MRARGTRGSPEEGPAPGPRARLGGRPKAAQGDVVLQLELLDQLVAPGDVIAVKVQRPVHLGDGVWGVWGRGGGRWAGGWRAQTWWRRLGNQGKGSGCCWRPALTLQLVIGHPVVVDDDCGGAYGADDVLEGVHVAQHRRGGLGRLVVLEGCHKVVRACDCVKLLSCVSLCGASPASPRSPGFPLARPLLPPNAYIPPPPNLSDPHLQAGVVLYLQCVEQRHEAVRVGAQPQLPHCVRGGGGRGRRGWAKGSTKPRGSWRVVSGQGRRLVQQGVGQASPLSSPRGAGGRDPAHAASPLWAPRSPVLNVALQGTTMSDSRYSACGKQAGGKPAARAVLGRHVKQCVCVCVCCGADCVSKVCRVGMVGAHPSRGASRGRRAETRAPAPPAPRRGGSA
jgi:hypothetical protein